MFSLEPIFQFAIVLIFACADSSQNSKILLNKKSKVKVIVLLFLLRASAIFTEDFSLLFANFSLRIYDAVF
jgi:hypothetical protein